MSTRDPWVTVPGGGSPGEVAERVVRGEIAGAVLPCALSIEARAALLRLARSLDPHPLGPGSDGAILGPMLAPTGGAPGGPHLPTYFDEVARHAATHDAMEALLAPFFEALTRLPIRRLTTPSPHAAGSLRVFPDGVGAPLHVDTYRPSPSFAHLERETDRRVQLSWYVLVQAPTDGGRLRVGGRRDDPAPAAHRAIALEAGDAVLFDGSNVWHEVEPAIGARPRLTFGGFAGLAPAGDAFLYWG